MNKLLVEQNYSHHSDNERFSDFKFAGIFLRQNQAVRPPLVGAAYITKNFELKEKAVLKLG